MTSNLWTNHKCHAPIATCQQNRVWRRNNRCFSSWIQQKYKRERESGRVIGRALVFVCKMYILWCSSTSIEWKRNRFFIWWICHLSPFLAWDRVQGDANRTNERKYSAGRTKYVNTRRVFFSPANKWCSVISQHSNDFTWRESRQ